jgi:plastocyanin
MRRRVVLGSVLVLLCAAVLTAGPTLGGAQGGTPAAPPAGPAGGVQKDLLGSGVSALAPGRTLLLQRRTFAPGADSGAHPAPGPVVLAVEAGTVGFKVVEGAALVTRAGADGSGETIAAGAEVTLNVGDSVFYDESVVHVVRNTGDAPAITLEARLNPTEGATAPAASPAGGNTAGTTQATVGIKDLAFTPASLEVQVGTTVIWTNQDATAHTVDGDQGEFELGRLDPGTSYRETFDKPGTYTYHCDIHPSMKATIVVT